MNIYVGNISFKSTDDSLRTAFAAHGAVKSAKIITDRDTGKSKGFGFVEMDNDAEGTAAIDALNGTSLDGREIKVSVARPKE